VKASEPTQSVGKQLKAQTALASKVLLFVILIVILRLVGATISTTVVIATLVAVFGPGLLPWESILISRRASPADPEHPAIAGPLASAEASSVALASSPGQAAAPGAQGRRVAR
jgi:hypothetical protein